MYLFVSIFLLMAVMGLFTQTFIIQSARIWENQVGAAKAMHTWHMAAYSLAKETNVTLANGASCAIDMTAGAGKCTGTNPSNGIVGTIFLSAPGGGTCGPCNGQFYLPVGYSAEVVWKTRVYRLSDITYIATFVDDYALGFTPAQMYAQMRRARIPEVSYGQIKANYTCSGGSLGRWFVTDSFFSSGGVNASVCYPTPATSVISTGSVGYVTVL